MFYADLSKPFSPAMIRQHRSRGHAVVYVHPDGGPHASLTVSRCKLPDAAEFPEPPGGFEPLPQFEKPLPPSWQHMSPGAARDAAMAAEGINSHNAQRARRRGVLRHKNLGY